MLRRLFAWINRYERHLSALAMIAGFAWDNIFLGRIDMSRTQIVFLVYVGICFVTIPALLWIEARGARTGRRPRARALLPIATQFALGGFWSGFLILYGRSASVAVSWPFLIVLFAIFLGNEIFRKYHERLVFTSLLYFFALYAYTIFEVPIYEHAIGTLIFIESGVAAVVIFGVFTILLRLVGRARFRADLFWIRAGALVILASINLFYFTNILPPLPLANKAAGIYHNVVRSETGYIGTSEAEPWAVRYVGAAPVEHLVEGDAVYAYIAVFAPTKLTTTIVHRWQWYDPSAGAWETRFALSYPIEGGTDGGYRGYSAIVPHVAGAWRVSVETGDGRVIARLPFTVAFVKQEPALATSTLP